jgi:DNA polymerase
VIFTPRGREIIVDPGVPGLTGVATTTATYPEYKCHRIGLRDTIRAPEGHVLVVGDSANIEARMVCWIAGQEDILEKYRAGEDLYCDMASDVYGKPVTKANKTERLLGKISVLGLGYGMGKKKFYATVTGPIWKVEIEQDLTDRAVHIFRNKYDKVVEFWRYQNDIVIPAMADGGMRYADPLQKIMTGPGQLLLPNGRVLRYPNLHQRKNPDPESPFKVEWVFDVREGSRIVKTRTYGGHLTENLCQALARIVVMDQAVAISRRYKVVMLVHDEVVCCVPEDQAEECKAFMLEVMSTTPEWATGLPIAAEVGANRIYSLDK